MSLDFNQEVGNGVVLVDFYADWCSPCRQMLTLLDGITAPDLNFKILKINIDEYSDIASEYEVMSIPTLILFKDGTKKATLVGSVSKEALMQWITDNSN